MVDNIRYYNFDIELIKKSVAAAILISFGVCINLTIGGITGAILFSFGLLGVCALKLNLFTGKAGYIFDSKENKKEILPIIITNLIAGWLFGATLSGFNSALITIAAAKVTILTPSMSLFFGAFFCGIIMYLAVEMYKRNKSCLGIIFGIPLFILCGFYHTIAIVIMAGMAFVILNPFVLLICTFGNIMGSLFIKYLCGNAIDES